MYGVLKDSVCNKTGCYALLGARKIGKTVLFLQLKEFFGDKAEYFDCSSLGDDYSFDFNKYYERLLSEEKKIILIDEVCKINVDFLADFVRYTKLYASQFCIIITGSVSYIVKKRCNEIGRGTYYYMPPFMYIERLCWNYGYDEVDINCIKKYTSDELFKDYLKNQLMNDRDLMGYMQGVVEDTILSYRERTFLEDCDFIDDNILMKSLKYISLCQLVYKKSNGTYVDIPSIEKELRTQIFEDYKEAKNKWGLSSKDISNVLKLLLGCRLAKKVDYYKGDMINIEKASISDDNVPALIFEFPYYCSICLSPKVQESESILDQWIEYALLIRASYIYQYVDKYRANDSVEVDVIYMTDKYNGIEVKNRPFKNNSESYIREEEKWAQNIGLSEIVITSSDSINRNDKVAACMELEYINVLISGRLDSDRTVKELLDFYGMD